FNIVDSGYDAIMQAYVDTGFRAAVAMSMGDMDFPQTLPLHLVPELPVPSMGRQAMPAADGLAAAHRFVQRWQGKVESVQAFLGPSAPQRCSDELLEGCFNLARDFDTRVHSQLLEARSQWFACQHRFGCSPVEALHRRGWLDSRFSGAHGVWLSR